MIQQKKQAFWAAAIVVLAVAIDQAIKLYVKNHFYVGEDMEITSWFHLLYVENNGMAFGVEWFSKYALTGFRIVAVGLLVWYIAHLIRKTKVRTGYIITVAFVIAGALGNIVDCMFYGDQFMLGKVVDMFYFPLIHNAEGDVLFFRPVFNFADSCITCAVIVIILFFRKELNDTLESKKDKKNA